MKKVSKVKTARLNKLLEVAKGIMLEGKDGVVLIFNQEKVTDGTRLNGCCVVHNVERPHLLKSVISAFSLSPLDVLLVSEAESDKK